MAVTGHGRSARGEARGIQYPRAKTDTPPPLPGVESRFLFCTATWALEKRELYLRRRLP